MDRDLKLNEKTKYSAKGIKFHNITRDPEWKNIYANI